MATPSKRRSGDESASRKPPIVKKSFMSMDAYTRHRFLISHYRLSQPGSTSLLTRDTSKDKTDLDVLKEYHKFLWDEEEEEEEARSKDEEWGRKLAKGYYEKLFKEYCICDLTHYTENKVAMRWRTEEEVVHGKGQFVCGEKNCTKSDGLKSWEVNFSYLENETKKNALVKLRLCSKCSKKLNYHHKQKEAEREGKKKCEDSGKSSEIVEASSSSNCRKRKVSPSSSHSRKRDMNEYLNELLE